MSKIKIGQIGTAHGHASGKLEVYRKSEDFEVVGIVEPDPKLRKQAEGQAPFTDVPWMTVEQLLAVPGLQAVAIETEPRHLLTHAEKCVEAGKHIHLDCGRHGRLREGDPWREGVRLVTDARPGRSGNSASSERLSSGS